MPVTEREDEILGDWPSLPEPDPERYRFDLLDEREPAPRPGWLEQFWRWWRAE